MRTIDWDWPAQLETCQIRIAELEAGIASQKHKIQHLSNRGLDAAFAQRVLVVMKQSLEREQSHKHLIETRMAGRQAI
jgi:uncharacterized coiled-coil protein SlyX